MAVTTTSKALSVWKGTAAQFAEITTKVADTIYFVQGASGDLAGTVYVGANKHGMSFKSVASFPAASAAEQGVVYLGPAGDTRFSNGTAWVQICYPLVTSANIANELANDAAVPTAKAVFTYVNTFATGLGRLLPAVQDITALKAVTGAMDKDLILVEASGALYRFDVESETTGNDDTIVAINGVTGRWIKMITATNMTAGNAITISNNVVNVNYDQQVFTVDTNGALTMRPEYIAVINSNISNAASAAAAAQSAADAAQADATQALADAAAAQGTANTAAAAASAAQSAAEAAQATANAALPKASNGVTYAIGGETLGATDAARSGKLATEKAVQAAIDAAVLGDIQGNIDSAVEQAASNKMDKVTNGTTNNIVALDANGNAKDSGKSVGGATLAATPTANVLATEAAVKAAADAAQAAALAGATIYWQESN